SGIKFKLWADLKEADPQENKYAYVYFAAISIGSVRSGTNNIGDWTKFEVAVFVPVLLQRCDGSGNYRTDGAGLLPVFTFLDNVTASAARTEVLGIPTTIATFDPPPDAPNQWMTFAGPDDAADRLLLQIKTEVLPAVGEGEKAVEEIILEIHAGDIVD